MFIASSGRPINITFIDAEVRYKIGLLFASKTFSSIRRPVTRKEFLMRYDKLIQLFFKNILAMKTHKIHLSKTNVHRPIPK